MADETYGEERARNLEALLRNLAARIVEMDARGELLKQAERFISEGVHPRVITDGFELAKKEALNVATTGKDKAA